MNSPAQDGAAPRQGAWIETFEDIGRAVYSGMPFAMSHQAFEILKDIAECSEAVARLAERQGPVPGKAAANYWAANKARIRDRVDQISGRRETIELNSAIRIVDSYVGGCLATGAD